MDSLHLEKPYLAFGYTDRQRAQQLVRASDNTLRIVDDASLYATLPKGASAPDAIIAFARMLLQS